MGKMTGSTEQARELQPETMMNSETHELSVSDLDRVSGGWGVLAGLAHAVAASGKGEDVKKDTIMTAPLIGL
jgi:hypothetical protein